MRATVALASFLLIPALAAAQKPAARVEIDHVTGESRLIVRRGTAEDTTDLGDERVVRLHRAIPVDVRVVNTNTALYRFGSSTEDVALPEVEQLRGFAGRVTPYVPELRASLARSRGKGAGEATAASEEQLAEARLALAMALGRAERGLVGVDQALFGENGLQPTLTTTLLALEQMRRGVAPERASEPLRQALSLGAPCGPTQDPVRLPTAQLLLSSLADVAAGNELLAALSAQTAFASDVRWRALADSASVLQRRAQGALSDFERLVDDAYRVERLVGVVARACSQWSAGEKKGSLTEGRKVTVRIEPRTEPELARLADRKPATYEVLVQPKALVRPAIGVAAIAAPDARFATYATREVDGGGVQVYESGRKDRRFGLGGTLGLTWSALDRGTVAVWLPELMVAAGDLTGAGIGTGVSVGFLKLSAGAMWLRHERLDGVRAGDVVPDESFVRRVDAYGKPRLYFSLSVFDWAPFANRLPGQ